MAKNQRFDTPESLLSEKLDDGDYTTNAFAHFDNYGTAIESLAGLAEEEDWSFGSGDGRQQFEFGVLSSYLKSTYRRVAQESKVLFSPEGGFACFDTGLLSRDQLEPLYALFVPNSHPAATSFWKFQTFFRQGEHHIQRFDGTPEKASYWDSPSQLVYDARRELVVNKEHIVQSNKGRFPAPFDSWDDFVLQNYLDGCIGASVESVRRNYRLAIPQYFFPSGTIQLLLPLYLSERGVADLALVVDDYQTIYRASTCLTLDMAYSNARLLARLEKNWLNP